jgi:hypothetical protein
MYKGRVESDQHHEGSRGGILGPGACEWGEVFIPSPRIKAFSLLGAIKQSLRREWDWCRDHYMSSKGKRGAR